MAERRVLALVTMDLATSFSIPPAFIWAAVKLCFLALGSLAVVAFMRQLKFSDRHGKVRGIQPASIAFVTIALPLTIAIGSKSQNVATLSGWNYYPTLTYGPFVFYLLVAALVLRCSELLQRNYRVWVAPIILVVALMGLAINLSYELLALSIPLCAVLLLLQPMPTAKTLWLRWRAKTTVFLAFAGTFTAIFVWIRWRISQMDCHITDTCYSGAVPEFNARTLWFNFVGAVPGGTGKFVGNQAKAADRDFPVVNSLSVAAAVLGACALLALWAAWNARHKDVIAVGEPLDRTIEDKPGDDVRGLLIVMATGLTIAIGSAVITGISARAVELVQTPMLPYRNGVVTWSALALSVVVGVRLLMLSRWRVVGFVALASMSAVLIVGIGLYLPRNILSAQENRAERSTQFIDDLHWEVALGDDSVEGDSRRCESIRVYLLNQMAPHKKPTAQFVRAMTAANASYGFYHHKPYCSTGEGLEK